MKKFLSVVLSGCSFGQKERLVEKIYSQIDQELFLCTDSTEILSSGLLVDN